MYPCPLMILNTGFLKSFWRSLILFHIMYYKGKVAAPSKHKPVGLRKALQKTEYWFIQAGIRKKSLRVEVKVMLVSTVCEVSYLK